MTRIKREAWRPVPEYAGLYDVSDRGRVRSYHKSRRLWPHPIPRMCNVHLSPKSYPVVALSKNGKVFIATVSRLVLAAFVGPAPKGKPYACHNDQTPTNSLLGNLRWDSNAGNQLDRITHGTSNRGSRNGMSVLTEDDVRDIRNRLLKGETQTSIASAYGVDSSCICNIKRGRNWAHLV